MNNTQPTQEQLKEFWERCGFYTHSHMGYSDADSGEYQEDVYNPKGKSVQCFPKLTLDNLFKYAVPRFWIVTIDLLDGIFWSVIVSMPAKGSGILEGKALSEKPELALFWAIWEVIKE